MTVPLNYIRRILLGLGILALAGLSACGGGGGSGATPSDSGGGVIAIEVPAVNSVSDIMYISGPVGTSVGSNLSAKSLSPYKVALGSTFGPNTATTKYSLNACESANNFKGLLNTAAHPDLITCLYKNEITLPSTFYDGQYHGGLLYISQHDTEVLMKIRLKFETIPDPNDSSKKFITDFTLHICRCADNSDPTCASSTQTSYMNQTYNINGAVTIAAKDVEENYSGTSAVTGTIAGTTPATIHYESKTVTQSEFQDHGSGSSRSQSSILTQPRDTTIATVEGFIRRKGNITQDSVIYAKAELDYTGDPVKMDLSKWNLNTGSAWLVDDILDQKQCFDDNGVIATYPCAPYSDPFTATTPVTLMTPSDIPLTSFSGVEVVDCSSIVLDVDPIGSHGNAFVLENSTSCTGFSELDSNEDCYRDIYGDFTTTVTIDGINESALSTTSGSPTLIGTTTPTIVVTTNFTPYRASFFGPSEDTMGAIYLLGADPHGDNILSASDFEASDWRSAATTDNPEAMSLTFHPTMGNWTYDLKLMYGLTGINGDEIGGSDRHFYIAP